MTEIIKKTSLNLAQLKQPVVVTGALGFIGKRTIHALLELGANDIVAFDLPGQTLPVEWAGKVRYEAGDISQHAAVDKAMKNAGTVIHLAAMVGDWIPLAQHEKVTIDGSRFIFAAALENNTRVVLASSIVVYGDQLTNGACPEDKKWGKSVGAYSFCKQKQEKLAWEYHEQHRMPLSVVRPANVYGPGSRPWVDQVIETLEIGTPMLINGGDFNAALVHVDNVVQMLLLAATKDEALGQAFNGGDGNTTTWLRYFSDLSNACSLPAPKSVPLWIVGPLSFMMEKTWRFLNIKTRPPLTKEALNIVSAETTIPITKAERLMGYHPKISYAEGLKQVQDYLKP